MHKDNPIDFFPLADYFIGQLGYKVVRGKDCRSWRALEGPTGHKVLVCTRPAHNGKYIYKDLDTDQTRNLSHFLRETGSMDTPPPKSVPEKEGEVNTLIDAAYLAQKNQEKLDDCSWYESDKPNKFLASRAIDFSCEELKRLIWKGKISKDRALFPLFLAGSTLERIGTRIGVSAPYKLPVFSLTGSTEYSLVCRKGRLAKGSKRGFSILGYEPGDVFLFESPIDALSFHQIQKMRGKYEGGVYISTCGNLSGFQKEGLTDLISAFSIAPGKVYSCFDNDSSGHAFHDAAVSELKDRLNKPITRLLPPDGLNDWNDYLMASY